MFKATRMMGMQPTRAAFMRQSPILRMKPTQQLYLQQSVRMMKPVPKEEHSGTYQLQAEWGEEANSNSSHRVPTPALPQADSR
jgi:hypothetical protein